MASLGTAQKICVNGDAFDFVKSKSIYNSIAYDIDHDWCGLRFRNIKQCSRMV